MAIKITDECINCGACEPECPNNAIYEGGAEWRFADGTKLKGMFTGKNTGLNVSEIISTKSTLVIKSIFLHQNAKYINATAISIGTLSSTELNLNTSPIVRLKTVK